MVNPNGIWNAFTPHSRISVDEMLFHVTLVFHILCVVFLYAIEIDFLVLSGFQFFHDACENFTVLAQVFGYFYRVRIQSTVGILRANFVDCRDVEEVFWHGQDRRLVICVALEKEAVHLLPSVDAVIWQNAQFGVSCFIQNVFTAVKLIRCQGVVLIL
jgi:hypothetical protein